MTRIKNWSFISRNPYLPPEAQKYYISGEVYNHPDARFPDGKSVVTSRIQRINPEDKTVDCVSRTYQLEGPPDPEWKSWLKENDLLSRYQDLLG